MKSLEYLEQLAKTEVIDCAYNDKAKKTIAQIFPVGIAEIKNDLDRLEKLEKVVETLKKEDFIIKTDESDKDLPYLIMAMKFKDKIIVFYETFDKKKIDLLKEVFGNEKII